MPGFTGQGEPGPKGPGDIFGNNMFWQYLMSAGADLLGNTPGKNTTAAFNQNLQSMALMNMLGQILSGKIPGAKLTAGDGQTTMKFDHTQDNLLGKPAEQATAESMNPNALSKPVQATGALEAPLSPFSEAGPDSLKFGSKNIGMVAGLTPESIMAAMNYKQSADALQQKKIQDMADILYKQGLLSHYQAIEESEKQRIGLEGRRVELEEYQKRLATAEMFRKYAEMNQQGPLEVPGLGPVTFEAWKSLPTDMQAYSYYVYDQKVNKKPALDFDSWKNQEKPPNIYEIYRYAVKDPKFRKFYFESQESGATVIDMGARKIESSVLEPFAQLHDPGHLANQVRAALSSPDVSTKLEVMGGLGETDKAQKLKNGIAVGVVESIIASGGGQIIEKPYFEDKDRKVVVYKIKWPPRPGKTTSIEETFRYVLPK